jgi:ABC-type oligopeptide transport system substrate-binding subunit
MDYVSPLPEWAEWTQQERNEEARRLYANAGYTEDKPLRFEIRYNVGENNKKMALAVASLWKQVLGVQATLVNEEIKVFIQNREQKVLTQVFRAGWISDYADAYSFLNLFRSGHGRNDFGYSNSLYDSLLDEIAAERIPPRRRRLMFEAERLLLSDTPFIPVYTYVTKRMVSPRLKGWQSNVMDHHYSKDLFFLKTAAEAQAEAELQAQQAPLTEELENDMDDDNAGLPSATEDMDGTMTVEEQQTETQDGDTGSLPEAETKAGDSAG